MLLLGSTLLPVEEIDIIKVSVSLNKRSCNSLFPLSATFSLKRAEYSISADVSTVSSIEAYFCIDF
ncbi:hypothetical protein PGB90_008460 [Kerria lacca]